MSTEKPKTLASHAVAEGDVSGSSGDSHLGPDDTRTSSATAPVILTDSNENVDNDFAKEVIVTTFKNLNHSRESFQSYPAHLSLDGGS